MKYSFLPLYILTLFTLLTGCTDSVQASDILKKFLINPKLISPEKLQVDFDGDGVNDKIFTTGLKGASRDISKHIKLVRPWQLNQKNVNSNDLSTGSKNNFYIVLSKSNAGFVISDGNPISILDTEAAEELFMIPKKEFKNSGLGSINNLTGDLLGIPTEAGIDTYLFWNGETFISYEPLEIP